MLVGTSLTYFRLDQTRLLPRYLAAYFTGRDFQNQLKAVMSHSTRNQVPITAQRKLTVVIPPLADQRRIADILGKLDDKIELNRRMNETLEAMARRLFKSWFVDFDPVHAKAALRREHPKLSNSDLSRRVLPNLDPKIAELFPDSFEDSTLGPIPKGWTVDTLESVAEVIMGTSPPGDTYNDVGIGMPLVNGPVEFGERFTIRRKWTTKPNKLSQSNDLIFCVRGSTTGRRVIADGIYCLGRGVCAMRPLNGEWCFIHQLVEFSLERMLSRVSGSVFPNLNGPDLKQFLIVDPKLALRCAYQHQIEPLMFLVARNARESAALVAMRDKLLPELLSGQLAVSKEGGS